MGSIAGRRLALRRQRHLRVRKRISGTAQRPRLAVFRSARHISAQVIDDTAGRTLAAASSTEAVLRAKHSAASDTGAKVATAQAVGELLAKRAGEAGIRTVVFDRGGYKYHGRVAAVADAARKAGLEF